jgi:pimeloyl-ACP methyl ester carboxylesterase
LNANHQGLAIGKGSFDFIRSEHSKNMRKHPCIKRLFLVGSFLMATVSYSQTEVTIVDSTAVRVIRGTLLLPASATETVVLLIAGSGPTNRNGNQRMMTSNYFKLIAAELAAKGVASLRYDKRGIGQSTMTDPAEERVVLDDFVSDAVALIARLRADTRFKKVFVFGHSEGSLVGMLACQRAVVDGFISAAGIGRPLDVVLKAQLKDNPYNPKEIVDQSFRIIDSLKAGHRVKQVSPVLFALFRPSVQPFLISVFSYDPARELAKLRVPVQIVQGTTDIQVGVQDAEILRQAQPRAVYTLIEGMNHVFREAPADRMLNIATYTKAELPLAPGLMPSLLAFIASVSR